MVVPPFPVRPLVFVFQLLVLHVSHVTLLEPAPVGRVFMIIPVVVDLVLGVIDASRLLFVPLVIILRRGRCESTNWRQQCRREKQRSHISISTVHDESSRWGRTQMP